MNLPHRGMNKVFSILFFPMVCTEDKPTSACKNNQNYVDNVKNNLIKNVCGFKVYRNMSKCILKLRKRLH